MGIEPHAYLVRRGPDLLAGSVLGQQAGDGLHVRVGQHVGLGENQPVDRIVGGRVPVDQLVDHVRVRPERENGGHGPDRQPGRIVEPGPGGQLIEVLDGVRAESTAGLRIVRHYLLNSGHASLPSGRSRHRCGVGAASVQHGIGVPGCAGNNSDVAARPAGPGCAQEMRSQLGNARDSLIVLWPRSVCARYPLRFSAWCLVCTWQHGKHVSGINAAARRRILAPLAWPGSGAAVRS